VVRIALSENITHSSKWIEASLQPLSSKPKLYYYDQYQWGVFWDDVGFLYDVGSLKRELLRKNSRQSVARPNAPKNYY
jgi:hypothetical protein